MPISDHDRRVPFACLLRAQRYLLFSPHGLHEQPMWPQNAVAIVLDTRLAGCNLSEVAV